MLMWPDMVVPEAEDVEILLRIDGRRKNQLVAELLERLEEALDAAILPRREWGGALMADAEQAESESEERRGERGFIVGTDGSRLAEAFDRVQDGAEDGDRGLGPKVGQSEAGAGAVIEEAVSRNRGGSTTATGTWCGASSTTWRTRRRRCGCGRASTTPRTVW